MALGMIGGIARLSEEKTIGIPGHEVFAPGTSIERLIPTGSPYMVSLRGLYSGKVCTITFRITPSKGEDYEAVYSWGDGKCYVNLNTVTTSAAGEIARSRVSGAEQASACTKGFS
jgi:hypothetical protein